MCHSPLVCWLNPLYSNKETQFICSLFSCIPQQTRTQGHEPKEFK